MHSGQDVRIVKCLDGLHYSFEVLNLTYNSLYDDCAKIPTDNAYYVPTLWRCWSFVDTLHRIREVSQALPGLSRKKPEFRAFLESTEVVKTYRHYIQHLRSELSKKEPNSFPVWGSLSWVDPNDPSTCYSVLADLRVANVSYSGCVFDRYRRQWVSRVSLGVEHLSLNFDPLFESAVTFSSFVLPWAASAYSPGIHRSPTLPIIAMRFEISENDQ